MEGGTLALMTAKNRASVHWRDLGRLGLIVAANVMTVCHRCL